MQRAVCFSLFLTALLATSARAEMPGLSELGDGLKLTVRNISYVQFQQPSDLAIDLGFSSEYPENIVQNDLRADISYARGPFDLDLKPRANVFWQSWTSGVRSGQDETSADLYFYEWFARVDIGKNAFAGYGLLNLQWGPSFLLSPSNPFDERNGKDNPWLEYPPASYYAEGSWFPNPDWTISAIANVDKGDKQYARDFHSTYAVKADYVFQDGYVSIIPSYTDQTNNNIASARLGYYAGYNFSDSTLGYIEGSAANGDSETLLGVSYTTNFGPTMVLEYFHNSSGSDSDIQQLLLNPPEDVEWREALLRKNYVLLQAYDQNVFGNVDYVLRWVTSPDDHSQLLNAQLNLGVSDMMTLFTVATAYSGDDESEATAARDYQVMTGLQIAF